ncbi:MAG: hypothetical protein M3T56_20075 [Chloroflexota bacterium]|nr:hypothetical protein [Chloroflexota bacterium]MDQ2981792.1 hypothetical protein [Actinomycetota bacterium]
MPRIDHAGRVVGDLVTAAEAAADDESANKAAARATADALFESVERGHYWFPIRFETRAELESYPGGSSRFSNHRWRPQVRSHLRSWHADAFTIRRSVQFEVLRVRS